MGPRYATAAVVLMASAGCYSPLAHPLRASPGPIVEVSAAGVLYTEGAGHCYSGCVDSGNKAMINPLQLSVGGGMVFAEHYGLQLGVYGPAPVNQQHRSGVAAWATTYAHFTWQNPWFAAGFGQEFGAGGTSVVMSVEAQRASLSLRTLRLGAYARWFVPWDSEPEIVQDRASRDGALIGRAVQVAGGTSIELGLRAQFGPLLIQYAYVRTNRGEFLTVAPIEGLWYSQALHVVTLGFVIDGELLRAAKRAREDRRRRRPAHLSSPARP